MGKEANKYMAEHTSGTAHPGAMKKHMTTIENALPILETFIEMFRTPDEDHQSPPAATLMAVHADNFMELVQWSKGQLVEEEELSSKLVDAIATHKEKHFAVK